VVEVRRSRSLPLPLSALVTFGLTKTCPFIVLPPFKWYFCSIKIAILLSVVIALAFSCDLSVKRDREELLDMQTRKQKKK
jgi:hypothetical protein